MSTTIPEPDLGPLPPTDTPLKPPEMLPEDPFDDAPEEETAVEEVTELSDEERLLFSQLMTVGQRSKVIDVMGFSVRIQNLCVDDDLRIGMMTRQYEGSQMSHRAYQLGVCAAGIRTINNAPLISTLAPMTPDEDFDAKVEVLRKYYPIVITQIYNAVMALDQEFAELAVKLGKLDG